jgi:hypothetical protein
LVVLSAEGHAALNTKSKAMSFVADLAMREGVSLVTFTPVAACLVEAHGGDERNN